MRFSRPFTRASRGEKPARRASAAFPLPPLSAVSSEEGGRGESVGSFRGWRKRECAHAEHVDAWSIRVHALEEEVSRAEEERDAVRSENEELQRVVREIAGEGQGSVVARMRREVERLQWKVREERAGQQTGDLMMLIASGGFDGDTDEEDDWRERDIQRLEDALAAEWEQRTALEDMVRELEERVEGREREIRDAEEWKQKWKTERERVLQLEKLLAERDPKLRPDRPRSQRTQRQRQPAPQQKRRLSWMAGGGAFFQRATTEL